MKMPLQNVIRLWRSNMPQSYPTNGRIPVSGNSPAFKPWAPSQTFGAGVPANDNSLPVPANDNFAGRDAAFKKVARRMPRIPWNRAVPYLPWAMWLAWWYANGRLAGMVTNYNGLTHLRDCPTLASPTLRHFNIAAPNHGTPPVLGSCINWSSAASANLPRKGWAILMYTMGQSLTPGPGGQPRYDEISDYWSDAAFAGGNPFPNLGPIMDPLEGMSPLPRPGFGRMTPWPGIAVSPGWPSEGSTGGQPAGGHVGVGVSPPVVIGTSPSTGKPITNPASWPTRRPPGRGVKERKLHVAVNGTRIGRLLGGYTEFVDLENALWDALPQRFRSKLPKSYASSVKSFAPNGLDSRVTWIKFRDLYRHWDEVDLAKALKNVARNEMGDFVVGRVNKKLQKAWRKNNPLARRSVVGPTTGPAI